MGLPRGRVLVFSLVIVILILSGIVLWGGGSAADEPSWFERAIARRVRNFAIPRRARHQTNPWKATPENAQAARETFLARCAGCHSRDGSGQTQVGRELYPKPPDLRQDPTQDLTDGEIHFIIENGVRLTGMPASTTCMERQTMLSSESLPIPFAWTITDLCPLTAPEPQHSKSTPITS